MSMKEKEAFIHFETLLLNYYKSLFLHEDEVLVILMVNLCLKRNIKFVTPDILILKMNFTFENLEKMYVNLSVRGYISNVRCDDGKMETSLDGIKDLLLKQYFLENNRKKIDDPSNEGLNNIYSLFENELGRPLTPFEINILRDWNEQGFTMDKIQLALQEAIKAKVRTIRYVDKILLSYRQQAELSKEGNTTLSDKWRKNIEETIEIAKTRWIDHEDE